MTAALQLALFDAPAAPPVAPLFIDPQIVTEPEVSRSLWCDPDGPSIAGYDVSAPHPLWPHVDAGLSGRIETYYRHPAGPWLVSMHLCLADDARTQWNFVRSFGILDHAARELADLVVHAERLFLRSLLGEHVITPSQRREHAAQAAADCDPAWIAASAQERSALAVFEELGFKHSDWRALWMRHGAARSHAREVRERFVEAFHRDSDWRKFL